MALSLSGDWLTGGQVGAQAAHQGSAGTAAVEAPAAALDDAGPLAPEQACVRAHEQAQLLRLDGNLMQSRSALKACSLEACPAVVQRDCVRWLDEVSLQIPTVVFEAVTESGAAQRVTVRQREQVLTRELDGRPLEMNPGYYEFRFEVSGRPPKLVSVLLKQGDKNKLVSVDFRPMTDPATPSVLAPAPILPPPPTRVSSRPTPTSVYALAGVALVGAGAATILGINTRAKEERAYEDCAPRCPDERIDSIERWALATDVAIGVAVVTTVAATILYVRRPMVTEVATPRSAHVVPSVGWQKDSGWAGVEGSFW